MRQESFKANRFEKLTIAFFGIRGVGSFHYLAYAAKMAKGCLHAIEPGRLPLMAECHREGAAGIA
ncbi:hypothetical protein, partial [Sphingobium tyrosinilyticum]